MNVIYQVVAKQNYKYTKDVMCLMTYLKIHHHKEKKVKFSKPMILVMCTPLMSRANESIQQAEETIFCDSTSTLLKFGCYGSNLKDVYFASVLSQHHEGVKGCLQHTFKVLHLHLTP